MSVHCLTEHRVTCGLTWKTQLTKSSTRFDRRAVGVGRSGSGPALPFTSHVAMGKLFCVSRFHLSVEGRLALTFSDFVKLTQRETEGEKHITMKYCNQRHTMGSPPPQSLAVREGLINPYFRKLGVTDSHKFA